ncbi:glycoside hydrolase family 3 N-terminal domain-containing protein [Echinicola rosea]|uniref:beta-N-acetylhexosaminidase n=1 Tax=Echinicola rosea TaxID=1807691 RepID=A0ABQ1UJN9_9BACT|nr:glycoside hydrolase family 3 N-terminal domain-containing protein [Echinicola rosea]GGF18985.1 beta-N-acetylglucosaminidase [Echinicola rosea]
MNYRLLKSGLLVLAMVSGLSMVNAQSDGKDSKIPFLQQKSTWADSVFKTMSEEERIAQLIMIPVYSNRDRAYEDSIAQLVEEYKVGGLIFFQGGPGRQASMTNRYQQISEVPLMVSIDAEWGLGMRLDSTMSFPYQMALGGIEDERLIYEMGAEIARQCKRIGVNVNFAPVVDINNNANNPVIGFRSFGEDKENVASKAMAYMRGMQDEHVLANAKHFPGHGDTDVDSHVGLPLISFSRERLEKTELYPFRKLMNNGLGSVMVAHMSIPVLDDTPNLASTLSKPIVTDLLKGEIGYEGLVFTDALNMQGVAKFYPPGIVDVKALLAGNDMLLNTMDVKTTIVEVKKAIANGEITQEEVDKRVMKVLRAKDWQGLSDWQPVVMEGIYEDLNSSKAKYLNRQLVEASITLLRNEEEILPIKKLADEKLAYVSLGTDEETAFQQGLSRYVEADQFFVSKETSLSALEGLLGRLQGYSKVIVGVHHLGLKASVKNFGITAEMNVMLKKLIASRPTVVAVFGNVYSLDKLEDLEKASAVIAAYQESELTQDVVSQLVFGGVGAKGKLPVTINRHFAFGDGLTTAGGFRFSYVEPEAVGIARQNLDSIQGLVEQAIAEKAIPGASVLVAKDGKVFYQQAFGHHTYEENVPVQITDLYDLASVTKISTSLAALMQLHGEGEFDENKTLGDYLPMARGTNKEDLIYKDILTHQAGLTSWIAFWKNTVRKNGSFKWFTFKDHQSKRFPIKVADNLYIHRHYADKIYKEIMKSPVSSEKEYVYSDLSFILAPKVVEHITGENFIDYLNETIYDHLGASTLTFNPYQDYPVDRVVPTEYDSLFRRQLLHGTVHDEGAAMLGGISGHAGLFGDANDLAKLMQLYLNDGEYAGEMLIKGNTVSEFGKCQFCPENYRALGFDRPRKPGDPNGNSAPSAPASSFGHTGFTGTYAWVDPENQLVYIFLSNRVNPTRENTKLYQLNTRTNVLEVVYQAMK